MIDAPVVAYDGNVPGLKATRPAKGEKIDPSSPDVIRYTAYLDELHGNALHDVGGGRKIYDYHYSYNGFAAELTEKQAEQIKSVAGVVSVAKMHSTLPTPPPLQLSWA